ncbi:MAG TPA: DUF4230 domain-containing protein [Anaerolineales bacterium]|nr:DUF4230 domain-containing protein [Anaerolineales bacterium]
MTNDNNLRSWALVIGVLLIVALGALGVVFAVRESMEQAREVFQPVNDMTSNLGTQVASALNPTPTVIPDPVTIIYQVRSLARLETIQYSIEKVVTAETGQGVFGPLFGDRLLFVAHGEVIAGIDLQKLGPQDMWVEGGILYVRLPQTEIFVATLNNEKSYVYDRDTGLLTHGDVNLETTARQAAEDAIEQAAIEDGILEQARLNAEIYMERLLDTLGFEDVIFVQPTLVP